MLSLRGYQKDCLEAIEKAEAKGIHSQLVCLPTGAGKTIIFATLAKQRNRRTLILAHRDELIQQAVDKLQFVWPDVDLGVIKAERNELSHQVIVASVQTLSRESRLLRLPTNFDLVITDEAHHSIASTYRRIYDYLGLEKSETLHLGVTATPNRADQVGLGHIFAEVVFERTILDLIRLGYLCDLRCEQVKTEIDVSSAARGKDFAAERLAPLINTENANALIVDSWLEHAKERRTLAFTANVQHALSLAAAFCDEGVEAAAVWGAMPLDDRRGVLRDFAKGNVQLVTNCGVLTEGYDNPRIDCILTARPTKSTGLYTQMIGRGTRIYPDKTDCLILDVACISHRHNIVGFPDLLGLKDLPETGETLTEALEREASERDEISQGIRGVSTLSQEVDLFAGSRLVWTPIERGHLLNLGKHGKIKVYTAYENPEKYHVFHFLDGVRSQLTQAPVDISFALGVAENRAREATQNNLTLVDKNAPWRKYPASEKQIALLRKLGVPFDFPIRKGDAHDLISQTLGR